MSVLEENFFNLTKDIEITNEKLEISKKIKIIEILKMKENGERGLLNFLNLNPNFIYKDFDEIIENIEKIEKEDILNLIKKTFKKENLFKVVVSDINL